ncbi:hypothetical protein LR48_Vigan11g108200 [Vigna angularis]|uniref:Uncharacterized protein n=1 Tax=Phaseolus angularis TaxID=3914 RepID=A0A0L9VTH3_PHAAN|nr:hypothetical protein LR48_Vigan11g108200 [Vigna angularis]
MEVIDTNNDVKPMSSFRGRSLPKSCSLSRDVSMERNSTSEEMEQHRTTSDDIAKMLNASVFSRVGVPAHFFTPPGTVVDVAKAAVANSAATREHDWEVFFSQSPSLLTRFWCVWMKISPEVL